MGNTNPLSLRANYTHYNTIFSCAVQVCVLSGFIKLGPSHMGGGGGFAQRRYNNELSFTFDALFFCSFLQLFLSFLQTSFQQVRAYAVPTGTATITISSSSSYKLPSNKLQCMPFPQELRQSRLRSQR